MTEPTERLEWPDENETAADFEDRIVALIEDRLTVLALRG